MLLTRQGASEQPIGRQPYIALPRYGRDVLNRKVAPHSLGNVHFIGSGNGASLLGAWVLLLVWRAEFYREQAEWFQSWDVVHSLAGLHNLLGVPVWAGICLQAKDDPRC